MTILKASETLERVDINMFTMEFLQNYSDSTLTTEMSLSMINVITKNQTTFLLRACNPFYTLSQVESECWTSTSS